MLVLALKPGGEIEMTWAGREPLKPGQRLGLIKMQQIHGQKAWIGFEFPQSIRIQLVRGQSFGPAVAELGVV